MRVLKKIGKLTLYILLMSFLCSSFLFPNIKINARLSDKTIGVNEPFTLTVTVEGGNVKINMPDNINDFDLKGTSESKNIILSGARLITIQTFNYVYTANKEGIYNIGPIEAKNNGTVYRTKKLVINVVAESVRNPKNSAGNYSDDVIKELYKLDVDEVYVKNNVSKTEVYLHEAIYISQVAYTRVPVRLLGVSSTPSRKNFFTIIDNSEHNTKNETIDGKRFSIKPLRLEAIYPVRAGKKELELTSFLFQTSGGIFSDQIEKGFALYDINVLPLPKTSNKNFSGAVGEFDFNLSVDNNKIKIGESVSIKLKVRGEGNTSIIRMPKLDDLKISEFFSLYPIKSYDTNWFTLEGKVFGEKEVEYLMVAKESGNYKNDQIGFTYFSPNEKSYKTIYSSPINISISQSRKNIRQLNNENGKKYIMPIKANMSKTNKIFDIIFSNMFLYSYIFLGIIISLIFYLLSKNYKLKIKNKKIDSETDGFDLAKKYFETNDRLNYCKELEITFINSVSNILGIDKTKSVSNILIKMEEKNIDKEIISNAKNITDKIMSEIYSGKNEVNSTNYHRDMSNIIEQIKQTLI